MKNIKDYLHLYLGCEVQTSIWEEPAILITIDTDCSQNLNLECKSDQRSTWFKYEDIKPILRPLSDMTNNEAWECFRVAKDDSSTTNPKLAIRDKTWFPSWNLHQWSAALNFLRKKSFDVDGLIEAGLAIDATNKKFIYTVDK